ncbi:hypothetical protein GWI33_000571 [Rhynchophorus ferrugineus]|uniref:Uncharacterized protein n=1 Tax=Rhynchophorus ferrugineus TaxID=354439 RepID=A0A834IPC4_RHYFE|nr:hypothetical protein GWI33_000571 [Rhynchophorus ferrugineus]
MTETDIKPLLTNFYKKSKKCISRSGNKVKLSDDIIRNIDPAFAATDTVSDGGGVRDGGKRNRIGTRDSFKTAAETITGFGRTDGGKNLPYYPLQRRNNE